MTVKNIQLPKEHIFQKENDECCGPCCLSMVYKIKGKNISLGQILKDLKLGEKGLPTYPPQLARHLNSNGLRTKLTISNSQVISPAWANEVKSKVIENLKYWVTFQPKHDWHEFGLHALFYLQEGGEIELKSYGISDIKKMLDSGSTLILGVDEVFIWKHRFKEHKAEIDEIKGKSYGHFIVVTGYKDNKFSVLDPYPTKIPNKYGSYEVNGNDLLNASLIWAATILEVLK